MEYLLEKSIEAKNFWLTDIWNAREAIGNKEQDPDILQYITQQEAIRNFLGANIQPAQVVPLPEFSGVKRKQQRILEFFSAKNLVMNKESITFYSSLSPQES